MGFDKMLRKYVLQLDCEVYSTQSYNTQKAEDDKER